MSHSVKAPVTWLSLSFWLVSCSLQMPGEEQVFSRQNGSSPANGGTNDHGGASSNSDASAMGGQFTSSSSSRQGSLGGNNAGGSSVGANTGGANAGGASASGSGIFDPEAGLIAHFAFDEASGTVASNAKDASKSGTYVGNCSHLTGRVGGAVGIRNITSSTSTDWIELPKGILSGLNATTLTIWANDQSPTRNGSRVFHFSLGASEEIYFSPDETNPDASIRGSHLGGTHAGVAFLDLWSRSPDFTDKLWHHVAFTWSSAAIDLYLDGKKVGSKASPGALPLDLGETSPNWLGRTLNDKFIAMYAQLDDLRIYNRALSSSDIEQLYSLR